MGAGYRRVIAQKSDQAAVLKSCRFPETAGTENVLVNSANCFELALSTPAQNWMWKQAESPLVVVAAAVVVVVVGGWRRCFLPALTFPPRERQS